MTPHPTDVRSTDFAREHAEPSEGSEGRSARRIVAALRACISSVVGVISGIAPHVLHHVGPLAGAAIVAGTAGTVFFGAVGLLASLPFLWRLHRRSGGWRSPAVALVLFGLMFAVSTLVIGPAISGQGGDKPAVVDEHAAHHPAVK